MGGWDSDELGEENTMDDENLIQQRSLQSFQRRTKDLNNTIGATGATGATEEDNNRTISKDGERDDSRGLEEGEIVEDEGKNTEAAVASDEDRCAMDATKSTGGKNHSVNSMEDKKNNNNNKKSESNKKRKNKKKRKKREKKEEEELKTWMRRIRIDSKH